jgi:chitin disaccharide deacetylase
MSRAPVGTPLLRRLGLGPRERVLLLHADDVGMSEASVAAFAELTSSGLVASGSVMVPCPWFPHAAAFCRKHPAADVGVHLTLNSEWSACRWGPLSTRDPASGLLDEEGYFPAGREALRRRGEPRAIAGEMRAQVARARQHGIDVTHLDSHKLALFEPELLPLYLELAAELEIPALLWRPKPSQPWFRPGQEAAERAIEVQWEERGALILDHRIELPLHGPEQRALQLKRALEALPPGVTHCHLHPARDTPELRAMSPDWPCRVADLEACRAPELAGLLADAGIHLLGYRALRDLMRTP